VIEDGTHTVVLDRFEGDHAVLVTRDVDGADVVVPRLDLPTAGRHRDAVLSVEIHGGELIDASYLATVSRDRNGAEHGDAG
jgi:hypothetical protein